MTISNIVLRRSEKSLPSSINSNFRLLNISARSSGFIGLWDRLSVGNPKRLSFIRPFSPGNDADAVHYIPHTPAPSNTASEPGSSISPYIWAHPYIQLYPQNCFVIDSGTGTAVRYIVGAPDTKDYIARYRTDYIPTLEAEEFPEPSVDLPTHWKGELPKALLQHLYKPKKLLQGYFPRLLEEYPAHLHIDLLPGFQRRGYGRQLMESFLGKLKLDGARGVHLVMAVENENGDFYEWLGFGRFPFVLDGGASGEEGRHPGGIRIVKSLM